MLDVGSASLRTVAWLRLLFWSLPFDDKVSKETK
jgi:hypothetical protein